MIITRYFFKKWIAYTTFLALILSSVFIIIEALEKYTRSTAPAWNAIIHLAYLNSIPGWFDALPVASLLAGIIILKELYQNNEWETLFLISIKQSHLSLYALGGGILMMSAILVPYETIIRQQKHAITTYKLKTFKQIEQSSVLYNRWYILNSTIFFHATSFDLKANVGNGLFVLHIDPVTRKPVSIITGTTFYIDFNNNCMSITDGIRQYYNNQKEPVTKLSMPLESFKAQLDNQPSSYQSLSSLTRLVWYKYHILPTPLIKQFTAQLVEAYFYYLSLVLYPLLTITLWLLLLGAPAMMRWSLLLALYPCMQILLFVVLRMIH